MSSHFAWLSSPSTAPRVGLVVQAAYHLDEFTALRASLNRAGVVADLIVAVPPNKPLNTFRPGVRRYRELLSATGREPAQAFSAEEMATQLSAVVVMNDWGVPRPLVEAVARLKRPTFGWVEGVQDFADIDTGQQRNAYRTVDHVFCLGRYGAEQLRSVDTTIVGSARLRELWSAPVTDRVTRFATVNSNFTYGVQTEHRRDWLRAVRRAARRADVPYALSRHSAERGLVVPDRASRDPIGTLLERSTHLVSRFSTVCYEAMVRGVSLIYFNPHGEREPTFADPRGAFDHAVDDHQLASLLQAPVASAAVARERAKPFLSEHLRLDGELTPADLAVPVILDRLEP